MQVIGTPGQPNLGNLTGTVNLDSQVSDGTTFNRTVASDQTGNRIDFSKSLLNKQLDNIPDGTTYNRVTATPATGLNTGTAVDGSGNLKLKNVNNAVGITSSPFTNGTGFTTLAEMTVTITTKGNKVLIIFNGAMSFNNATTDAFIAVFRDGVQVSQSILFGLTSAEFTAAVSYIDAPTAASHTYDIRWRISSGTGTLTAFSTDRQLQVVELG